MKISSEISSAAQLVGEERAVEFIARAGFHGWDLSMFSMYEGSDHPLTSGNYLQFVRHLKQIGIDNGIICNQAHAPHPSSDPKINKYLKRAIECTAEAGGQICVIHPYNYGSAEENAQMYLELLPFAREHGVKIACENMWNWDCEKHENRPAACSTAKSFLDHLRAVNDDHLVACLDIGHAEMKLAGDGAVPMIHALGHYLQALHLHDNDLWHDYHAIPFSGDIDFPAVVDALHQIGYQGFFTLEAYRFLGAFTAENAFDGIKELANAAMQLAALFDRIDTP